MSLSKKISVVLLILSGTIVAVIAGYIFLTFSYEQAYKKIHFGQSQAEIASSMGMFFSKRKCSVEIFDYNEVFLGKCAEIYTYSIPDQQWEIAFDKDGKAIEKYSFFMGEYGSKAPE